MGVEAIIAVLIGVAGASGGFFEGRRRAAGSHMSIAVDTVELLQVQVAALVQQNTEKGNTISELSARIEILESMITQRAEVQAVHDEVLNVRVVVNKIAEKVGA